jgi:autotransporter-associated beta strand protein
MKLKFSILAFAAASLGIVQAQTSYTGTASTGLWFSSRWNNTTDAAPYTSAFTANNAASFAAGTYTFTGGGTGSVGNITLADGASVTFSAASGTWGTGGNVRTLTIGSGSIFDLSNNAMSITAGTGFIKDGSGVLALGGGTYAGGFTVNAGTVILRGTNAMGDGGLLTLNGGTVAGSATRNLTDKYDSGIVIGGNVQFGELATVVSSASSTANLTFNNNVGLGSANRTLTQGNNGTNSFSGIISNTSGGLTFAANVSTDGRFEITNASNTFTGPINVTGGEVRFTADGSIGNAANDIVIDGGRFAKASDALTVTLGGGRDISVGDAVGTAISSPGTGVLIYNNAIANKTGETGSWAKQGGGTLELGGVSTYTGDTSINNGFVKLTTGNDRLPTGTVVSIGQSASINLGTLDLNGRNQQIAGLNSTAGTNATASNNSVTSATAATLTLGGAGNYSFGDGTAANSGVIGGAISLVKEGSGTQTLGDTNTYTGTTTVNSGTLIINGNISTSLTTIKSGGTLGGSGYVGGLSVEGGGTLAPGNSPGILNVGSTSLATLSTFAVEINGNTVSTQYDQLNVTGTMSLAGLLSVTMGYTPADSALFFIIANDGLPTDAITGTFSNAPVDGGIYKLGGQDFKISYFGDSGTNSFIGGNDVVLMAIPEPSATLLVGGLGFFVMLRRRR